MTAQDAQKMNALDPRFSEQFFIEMNVKAVTYLARELRYTYQWAGESHERAIRMRIFKAQDGRSAISGVEMAFTKKEADASGKPQCHLDHIWTCKEAATAVWVGVLSYEAAARRLWSRDNIRQITKAENHR